MITLLSNIIRAVITSGIGFAVVIFVVAIIILGLTEFIKLVMPKVYKKYFTRKRRPDYDNAPPDMDNLKD